MSDFSVLLKAVVLGIVEGATEFLPVSSTGHLIVAADLLGMEGPRADTFAIFIQLGAVLAVAWDRRSTLLHGLIPAPRLLTLLAIAFLPAAVFGILVHDIIKAHLMTSTVVAWSLILGAVGILIIERRPEGNRIDNLSGITWRDALLVGFAQCAAFVPGVSRAAATIMGAMVAGWRRPIATEFSFLLAIPTIGAASVYDILKSRDQLVAADAPMFAVGLVVSFIVALIVVRWLIGYVRAHDFRPFAYWRLALGIVILALGIGP